MAKKASKYKPVRKNKVSNVGKLNTAGKPAPRVFYEINPVKLKTGWIQGTPTDKSYYDGRLNQLAHALRYTSDRLRNKILGQWAASQTEQVYREDYDAGYHYVTDNGIYVDEETGTVWYDAAYKEEIKTTQRSDVNGAWDGAIMSIVNGEVNAILTTQESGIIYEPK
jgi:hypothetical protein